jgi:Ser/Thr protein kinase RdoA (MazF antagonist)
VVVTLDGDTVVCSGDVVYEIHEKASGLDLYRDEPSWYPALRSLVESRPALARALEHRHIESDVSRFLRPGLEWAAPLLRRLVPHWGHGDWHPSNLTWSRDSSATIASVLDRGLANRTVAIHDLAVALERSAIDWLGRADTGDVRANLTAVDAVLDGYESGRLLDEDESTALVAVLPVVHVSSPSQRSSTSPRSSTPSRTLSSRATDISWGTPDGSKERTVLSCSSTFNDAGPNARHTLGVA